MPSASRPDDPLIDDPRRRTGFDERGRKHLCHILDIDQDQDIAKVWHDIKTKVIYLQSIEEFARVEAKVLEKEIPDRPSLIYTLGKLLLELDGESLEDG